MLPRALIRSETPAGINGALSMLCAFATWTGFCHPAILFQIFPPGDAAVLLIGKNEGAGIGARIEETKGEAVAEVRL